MILPPGTQQALTVPLCPFLLAMTVNAHCISCLECEPSNAGGRARGGEREHSSSQTNASSCKS